MKLVSTFSGPVVSGLAADAYGSFSNPLLTRDAAVRNCAAVLEYACSHAAPGDWAFFRNLSWALTEEGAPADLVNCAWQTKRCLSYRQCGLIAEAVEIHQQVIGLAIDLGVDPVALAEFPGIIPEAAAA